MLGDVAVVVVAVVGIGLDRLLGIGLKLRCMAEGLSSVEMLALDWWCDAEGSLCDLHQHTKHLTQCLSTYRSGIGAGGLPLAESDLFILEMMPLFFLMLRLLLWSKESTLS